MIKEERSDKWNEIQIEHTYMLMMLVQIKELLNEEQYKKIKKNLEEEFLKKIHEEEGEHGNSVDGGTEKSNPDKEL